MADSRRHIVISQSATSQAHLLGAGRRNTWLHVNRRDTLAGHSVLFSKSLQSVRGIDVFEALSAHQTQPPNRHRWYRSPSSVTTTEVVGLGVMLSIALMVLSLLVFLLMPDISSNMQTSVKPATSLPPKADELHLVKTYDQVMSFEAPLHPLAFIHKGPSDKMVNCSYLVNGTMIYQIQDGSPSALIHITGSHNKGWLNDGRNSLFSGITGLAVTEDGSSLYISDYNNSAIRQFMPHYNKMVDFAVGLYQLGSEAVFDPNIIQPTLLELYNLALFAIVKHDTGFPEILSMNIYTRRITKLPPLPYKNPMVIGGMVMRDWRLYVCSENKVWAMDSILIDNHFLMKYIAEPVDVLPIWDLMIAPKNFKTLISSSRLSNCKGLYTSPDQSMLYIKNIDKEEKTSLLAIDLSRPNSVQKYFDFSTMNLTANWIAFSVRALGQEILITDSLSLYKRGLIHQSDPARACIKCMTAPPGEGYLSYSGERTRDVWLSQSQSSCFLDRNPLVEVFRQVQQIEGQIRFLPCEDGKLYWDGHETWYQEIPYLCSIDSVIKEKFMSWNCLSYNCTLMTSGSRSIPCKNGGHCTNHTDRGWRCACPPGYTGQTCEVILM